MKVAAANVTGRDEGCEGGDGGSEGRGGLGEVKAGAELAAVAELVMATPRLVESWAVLPSSASQGRLGGIERWHDYGDLKDGTARGDLDGDGAHVHAQQTGKSIAELQRYGGGEVGGIACNCKGGRDDDHLRPAGLGGRR